MANKYKKVNIYGEHLKNRNIAFIVLDSVNAYKAPDVIAELRKYACNIFPYCTKDSYKYVTNETLKWASKNDIINNQNPYHFDAVIFYPVTNQFLNGLVKSSSNDYLINKLLYNDNLNTKKVFFMDDKDNLRSCNDGACRKYNVTLVSSDKENESVQVSVSKMVRALSTSSLINVNVLVTAGPTPVKIDNVRRIVNKFSGKLGIEIANELYLRGADVKLLQSYSGIRPYEYLNHSLFQDYFEYKDLCVSHCSEYEYGIFSAAVADYMPKEVRLGKIPSDGSFKNIELVKTEKIINLVREKNPNLKMISFKYEEGKTLDQLLAIANKRLLSGHVRVVANDLTLNEDVQKCFLCALDKNNTAVVLKESKGKINIARMIADDLEKMINKGA